MSSNLLNRVIAVSQWQLVNQAMFSKVSHCNSLSLRSFSHNTALITKTHRESFLKTYPALLVQSDGSSFYIRYHEPRSIIQLPLDLSTLTPEEMKERLAKRNPKKKVVYAQEEVDNYKASKYIKLVKKVKK